MRRTRHTNFVPILTLGLLAGLAGTRPAPGQIKTAETSPGAPRYGAARASHYRVGASIQARRGAVQKVRAMVAVPYPCPEQQVEVVDEDISEQVDSLKYRDLPGGGARQMLIAIGRLPAGEEAHAIVTFEVRTRPILPPRETANLKIPAKPGRELKRFLSRSPYIEVGHRKIRAAATEALAGLDQAATDWQRVEALYDYVQKTIDYLEGPDKSAVKTLKDRQGDCQAISALFVALCRTEKIPARIVWVHEHNYPEFYLEEPLATEPGGEQESAAIAAGKGSKSAAGRESVQAAKMADSAGTKAAHGSGAHGSKARPAAKKSRHGKRPASIGHWYPCESSGRRAFGEMPLTRTVLQKGDNFRVPERPRERLRYASDYLIGLPTPGGGKPSVKYIREQL